MEFFINVLRVNNRKQLPDDLRQELVSNAKYVRRADCWLFEGDWETVLQPWIDDGVPVKCLGEVVMETTRLSDDKLYEEIRHLLR